MTGPDVQVTERDTALPGLATVLDPGAVREVLAERWSGHRVEGVELTYLRYKPLTRCVAGYRAVVDGAAVWFHLTAYRAEDDARARRLGRGGEGAPFPPAVLPRQLVLRVFPVDRKLRALPVVADPAARRALLTATLPGHPQLWDAELEILRYKPERRLVARLRGERAEGLLKIYHDGDHHQAVRGSEAFSYGQVHSAPLLGAEHAHRLLVWGWLAGEAFEDRVVVDPGAAAQVGEALARLHRLAPHPALARMTRQEEAGSLDQPCRTTAFLLPGLGPEVADVRDRVGTGLARAADGRVGIHGDFSADQILLTADGPAILDLDDAAVGDAARDLGTFAAQLERRVLRGELAGRARDTAVEALLAGYSRHADPPGGLALQTAAALLRLAPHAFRTRDPGWPRETAALVRRAAALLTG